MYKRQIVDGNNTYATRDDALAAATGAGSDIISSADAGRTGTLYPSGGENTSEQYVTMIVYMPQNTGNEANYDRAYDAPEVSLGVKLVATQAQHEVDSFGKRCIRDRPYRGFRKGKFKRRKNFVILQKYKEIL